MIKPAFSSGMKDFRYPVVTMGTFDGVHIGHQLLLERVISRAKKMDGESVVITYYHHPKETINKGLATYLLTERERKTELIKGLGVDHIFYLQFDEEMAQMQAEAFLSKILIEQVKAKEIVFGYDCHFGHRREGNYHFLKDREKIYGYRSSLVKPVKIEGKIISSSLIRNMIRSGKVEEAEKFLGRYYDLVGVVRTGSGLGRELGYPTLNLAPTDPFKLFPANGVYLGIASFTGQEYFCLTNVGYCPTLKHLEERTIESYLIGYEGDLYNRQIDISFISRLRDEKEFPDQKSLQEAIEKDMKIAYRLIESMKTR